MHTDSQKDENVKGTDSGKEGQPTQSTRPVLDVNVIDRCHTGGTQPGRGALLFVGFLIFGFVVLFSSKIATLFGDVGRRIDQFYSKRAAASEMKELVKNSAAEQIFIQASKNMTIRDFEEAGARKLVFDKTQVCSDVAPAGSAWSLKSTIYSKADRSYNEFGESWYPGGVQLVTYFTQAKAELTAVEQEVLKNMGGASPFTTMMFGAKTMSYDPVLEETKPDCKSRSEAVRKIVADAHGAGFAFAVDGKTAQRFLFVTPPSSTVGTPAAKAGQPSEPQKIYRPLQPVIPRYR